MVTVWIFLRIRREQKGTVVSGPGRYRLHIYIAINTLTVLAAATNITM